MKRPVLLIIAAALLAGAWYYYHSRKLAGGELTLYGNVDIREVNLGFRVGGRVREISKDEGDSVKSGEAIAQLDDEPYQRELDETRAQLASAKAKVEMLESGYRNEDVAQSRAVVTEREATLANAQRAFDRQKELLRRKVATQQEYDDAAAHFEEAQARLKSARANLTMLEAGYRTEEVTQAKADVTRAQAAAASAELRLGDTILKSPAGGVVITRALEPGAIVQPGATVLTVSLTNPVWARAYVHEADLGRIHPGSKVLVYTDSRPGHPYTGQVGFISPRAEFTPKSVETTELRTSLVYRLRIIIADADPGLRQGMPVTAKLVP